MEIEFLTELENVSDLRLFPSLNVGVMINSYLPSSITLKLAVNTILDKNGVRSIYLWTAGMEIFNNPVLVS